MGGLAAALALAKKGCKEVNVYESAPALGFVGAGIQIPPNLIRILDHLGVWTNSAMEKEATCVKEICIYDGPTNKILARVPTTDIREKYGYAHHTGHRASLAGTIYDAAKAESRVHFHFGKTFENIISYGPGQVEFVVRDLDGKTHTLKTDLLIGADGIKSAVRDSMLTSLGLQAEVEETGTAAYRILIERQQMESSPELLELIDSDSVRRWIGEGRHIMAYPIHDHTIYNIATAQPDTNFAGAVNMTWTNHGDKKFMKKVYADFCPLIQKLLDLVPEGDLVEWRLRSHKPLDVWTRGNVTLLGDACHLTLPHLSQGAAMAIEDGASLAEILSLMPGREINPEVIADALKVYEQVRKPWTSTLVELASLSARTLHLGEGEAKKERDRQFAAAKTNGASVPDKWASPEVQKMIFEHDCIEDVRKRLIPSYKV